MREKVNFHYEYQLAQAFLPESQILKINREYEYMALLWGGVKTLANVQNYNADYLKVCEKLNSSLPQLTSLESGFDRHFWGEVSDKQQVLNSKETSAKISHKLGLGQNDLVFSDLNEVILFLEKASESYIIRTAYSVSGRGVFIYHPGEDLFPLIRCIKKESGFHPVIVTPYLNKTKDFSVITNDQNESILYETLVDQYGTFRGVLIDSEKVHSYKEWMSESDLLIYESIYSQYSSLGASKIQIDSFYYKHDEDEEEKIFHLVEVNARKTMGELAYRLYRRLGHRGRFFSFRLIPKIHLKKLNSIGQKHIFSPETSHHGLLISQHETEEEARGLRAFYE